jgi:hypothetical protein
MNPKKLRIINTVFAIAMVIMVIQILMVKFPYVLVLLGAYQVGSIFRRLVDYVTPGDDSKGS